MRSTACSSVEYRQLDAFELDRLDEHFDFVYCMGILHRVENPLGLLRVLRERTARGGTVLLETYGIHADDRDAPTIRVSEPGEIYARDDFVCRGLRGRRPRSPRAARGLPTGRGARPGRGRRPPRIVCRLIA